MGTDGKKTSSSSYPCKSAQSVVHRLLFRGAAEGRITDDNLWRPTRRAEGHYTKDKLSTRCGAVHSIGWLCGWPDCGHPPGGSSPNSCTQRISARCAFVSKGTKSSAADRLCAIAPASFAPSKMQASKGLRRRSAPVRSASRKMHCRKSVARRSQPRKSAPEKSHSINSFQQTRESDRSVALKLTFSKLDRPKNIRGKVRCERSEPCQPVRKKMILTGESSPMFGMRDGRWGAPSAVRGRAAPLASRKRHVSSRDFLNRGAPPT
jgi:hypothetical protein